MGIREEISSIHNEIVIVGNTLYRVVGLHISDDQYMIAEEMNWKVPHSRVLISLVCWYHTLKGKLSETEYQLIEQQFSANGSPRSEKFLLVEG